MVYFVGFIGFIGGFIAGQGILYFLLRNATQEDILNDPYIKWKYGLLNWAVALIGAYSAVDMYSRYYG